MTNNYNQGTQPSVRASLVRWLFACSTMLLVLFAGSAFSQVCSGLPSSAGTASAVATSICSGSTASLSVAGASADTGVVYQWYSSTSMGGPYTNLELGATDTLYTTGSLTFSTYYVLSVKCSNTGDSVLTNEVAITVLPNLPVSVVLGASSTSVCSGQTVTLTATPVNGGTPSYTFYVNAVSVQSSASASYTYTPANGDVVTVDMNSTAACATGNPATSNSVSITVNALPAAPVITPSGATTFCSGGSVDLTSSYTGGNTWSNAATTDFVTVNTSGSYSVTYTDGNGCSSTSAPVSVTVNTSTASITPSSPAFCAGGSVVISASSTPAAVSYLWSDASTGSTLTVNAAGTYTVTTTDGNGCTASTSVTVVQNDIPVVSISGNNILCTGSSNLLTANATVTNGTLSYAWSLNGTPIGGATSATYNATAAGSYTVTATSSTGCSATSSAFVITSDVSPLAGTYTIGSPASCTQFTSLANFLNAINTRGVSANVTLNVPSGYTETAPVGGFIINQCALAAGLKMSASQTLTIQKASGTNPVFTAPVGTSTTVDAIMVLLGADYVTLDGLNFVENATNVSVSGTATTRMEFGIALLKCDGNNGSNFNTVKNCTVSLANTATFRYTATNGIYSGNHTNLNTTGLTYSGLAGTEDDSRNGHNVFVSNTITNCYTGVYLVGNSAASPNNSNISLNDTLNYVGTYTAGNTITGFGGTSTTSYGIWEANQRGFNVINNTVTSATGTSTTLYGIYAASGVWCNVSKNTVTLNGTSTIYNYYIGFSGGSAANPNIVKVDSNTIQSSVQAGTGTMYGFYGTSPGGASAQVSFSYNKVQGCTSTSSGTVYCNYIFASAANGVLNFTNNLVQNNIISGAGSLYGAYLYNTGGTCNANNNTITNNTASPTSGTFYGLYQGSTSLVWNVQGNTITNNTKTATSGVSGTMYCFYGLGTSTNPGDVSNNTISGNTISGVTGSSTATIYGLYISNSSSGSNFHDNTVSNLSVTIGSLAATGTQTIYGMYCSASGANNYYNNSISGISTGNTISGSVFGAYLGSASVSNFYNNKICSINAGGSAGNARGIQIGSGTTQWNVYNNAISGVSASFAAPATAANQVMGIDISTTTTTLAINIYNNSIYLTGNGGGVNFGSSAIQANTGPKLTLVNNIFVNTITPGGSGGTGGATTAYRRSSATLTSYQTASNNNLFYAGTPGPNNLIYQEALAFTNSKQTLALYKTFVGPTRDAAAVTENPPFISTTCGNANNMHIAATPATLVEGAGIPYNGLTTDIDGNTRSLTNPDLGADEGAFTAAVPVVTSASHTPTTEQCTPVIHTVTANVNPGSSAISTVTLNFSLNGAAPTAIAMTNTSGTTWTADIPPVGNAVVTYTITAVNAGGLSTTFNNGAAYIDGGIPSATATAAQSVVCPGFPNQLTTTVGNGAGYAIQLNGSNQYVEVANSSTVNLSGNLTLEAWIRPTAYASLAGIISKYQSSSASAYFLRMSSVSPYSGIEAGNANSLGSPTGGTTLNTWYHVAAVFNGTQTTIYINGTQVANNATLGAVTQSTDPLRIGVDFFSRYFTGQIDEVRIWNAALSQSTLAAWKNNGITSSHPNYASLKAYYNFDELSGTTVIDRSGNGNTGTIMNGATRVASTFTFAPSYTYSWTPTSGLSSSTISNPIASVMDTTVYTVTITSPGGCTATATVSANVYGQLAAPTATPSSQCGVAIPAIKVSGGSAYNWYLAPTGGTIVQSATADSLTSYAISATTTFYVSSVNLATSCESPRTAVTATVSTPDAVSITVGANNVCPGTPVTLTVNQTGTTNTYAYTWNGTGLSATTGSPVIATPTAAGTQTFNVTAYDATLGCTAVASATLTTVAPPSITAISATPAILCAGSSTTLLATTTIIGTGPQTAPTGYLNPSFSSTADEELFNVTLGTINNTSVCNVVAPGPGSVVSSYSNFTTSVAPATLIAGQSYSASITVGYCAASTFSNMASMWIDYNRDGDFLDAGELVYTKAYGTSALTGTAYPFSVTIPLTATAGVTRMRVVLNESSTAPTPTQSGSWGEGEDYLVDIQSYVQGSGSYSWSWSDGSSVIGSVNSITANPTAPTTYTVTATDPATGCTKTATVTPTVNPVPTAPNATNSTQCGSAVPTASVSSTSGLSTPAFNWYTAPTGGAPVQSSTATSLTSYVVATTTTLYVAEMIPSTGCESPRTPVVVTVNQPDDVAISYSTSNAFSCLGTSVTLTATNLGTTNTYSYSWNGGTANSGISTPITGSTVTVTPLAAGTYTYSVTAVDGTCSRVVTQVVTINALPAVDSISATPNTVCSGEAVTLRAYSLTSGTQTAPTGYTNGAFSSTADEELFNVKLGSLNNTSVCNVVAPGPGSVVSSYSNFTTSVSAPTLVVGQTVNASITVGYCATSTFSNMACMWIDYNRDGDFLDAGELVYTKPYGASLLGGTAYPFTVTIPASAAPGVTRMRVVLNESSVAPTPTQSGSWGECEDYLVNIIGLGDGSYTWSWTPGGATTNITSVNPTSTTTYSAVATNATGCTKATNVTVNVNPLPAAPTAITDTICGLNKTNVKVSSNSGAAIPVYNWYLVPTGGTSIQLSTADSLTNYSVSTTTTFYVAEINPATNCEGPRTAVVQTVTQPDPITATTSATAFCMPGSVNLNATQTGSTNTYTYSWTAVPPVGSGMTGFVLGPPTTLFSSNFTSTTVPSNVTLVGSANIGGGVLQITPNTLSQSGGVAISGGGNAADSISVDFDLIVPQNGADGVSYSYCPDGSAAVEAAMNAENGTGSKLKIGFVAYNAGTIPTGGSTAGLPGIYLMYNCSINEQNSTSAGVLAYSSDVSWRGSATPKHVAFTVSSAGVLNLTLNGSPIFTNVQLPAAYLTDNKNSWNHYFKGRTGGVSEEHSVDNFNVVVAQNQTAPVLSQAITVTPTLPGTYTYYVVGNDGQCNASSSVTVTANAPAAAINAGADQTVCEGANITVNASGAGLIPALRFTEVLWQVNAGTGPTGASIPAWCSTWYTANGGTTMDMIEITNLGAGLASSAGVSIEMWNSSSTTAPAYSYTIPATAPLMSSGGLLYFTHSGSTVVTDLTNNFFARGGTSIDNGSGTAAGMVMRKNGVIIDAVAVSGYTFPAASGVTASEWSGALAGNGGLSGSVLVAADNNTASSWSNTSATQLASIGTKNAGLVANLPSLGTVSWTSIPAGFTGTSASSTFGPITAPTQFVVTFDNGTCQSYDTTLVTPFSAPPTPTISVSADSICNSGSATYNVTNISNGVMYQWQRYNTVSSAWENITDSTRTQYLTGTLTPVLGDTVLYIRVAATCGINNAYSNADTLYIAHPFLTSTVTDTVCGFGVADLSAIGNGTIGWYSGISGGTPVYTGNTVAASLGTTTVFWVQASVGTCVNTGGRVPVTVIANPATPITATSSPVAICQGASAVITASSSNVNYVYTWNGFSAGASQTVTPSVTTTYTVTGIDSVTGCGYVTPYTVLVNPIPSTPVITSSSTSACAGSSISLTASSSAPGDATVGVGSTTNASVGSSPYSGNWEGSKIQYLITASELAASNIVAGPITSLAFNVTIAGTTYPMSAYSIKLGTTSATALASYQTGLSTVYTAPGTVLPVTGWNNYSFTAPFTWNGTSNLVVEVCHNNDPVGACASCWGGTATVAATTTAYNSTYGQYADNTAPTNPWDLCSQISTGTTVSSTARPDMKFNAIVSASGSSIYNWSTSQTGQTVSVTPAAGSTTYSVTATSAAGCTSAPGSITINTLALPTPVLSSVDTTICSPASIDIYAVDNGAYSAGYPVGTVVEWLGYGITGDPATTPVNSSLGSTFQSKVTLPNGCFANSNTITVTTRDVTVVPTIAPAACGSSNGKVAVTIVSAPTAPYRYIWTDASATVIRDVTNSATKDSIYGLLPGTYYLSIYDNVGGSLSCSSLNIPFTVGGSTPATLSVTGTNITCNAANDGTVNATVVSGGTFPFTYLWSAGSTPTTASQLGLGAGTYDVTVTDALGCTATGSYTVTEPAAISATATYVLPCYGGTNGSITANVTGGSGTYNVDWYDVSLSPIATSTTTLSGVAAGDYIVLISDGNGCQYDNSSSPFTLGQQAQIVVSTIAPSTAAVGATVTLTGSGFTGATGVSFNGTSAVTYTVVSDNSITVTVPSGAIDGPITVYVGGCSGVSSGSFTLQTSATLNLKAYMQGYYIGGGAMNSVLLNQGVSGDANEMDTVTIQLRDQFDPSIVVLTTSAVMSTDGSATYTLSGEVIGGNYYIAVFHRNTVQTWSSLPVTFAATTSYDFTTSASQAYGDNQIEVETGVFAMYTGDLNQDEYVDPFDYGLFEADNLVFASGYYASDMNGDGFVDPFDYGIFEANNLNFILSIHP